MTTAFDAQQAAMEAAMQADVDAHAQFQGHQVDYICHHRARSDRRR